MVVTRYPNGDVVVVVQCSVVIAVEKVVTAEMARAEAIRLLPHPAIGTAPTGGTSLVNIETVLWVETPVDRSLGTVTLLGHRVELRAHVEQVAWDFGDGEQASLAGPGKAYTRVDPCRTAQCPNYFGHTYRSTGEVVIGARLTWSGQFRVDGGAWQDIAGTVSAPATDHRIHVKQARSVLVPDS